jgi:hypothetical protein
MWLRKDKAYVFAVTQKKAQIAILSSMAMTVLVAWDIVCWNSQSHDNYVSGMKQRE